MVLKRRGCHVRSWHPIERGSLSRMLAASIRYGTALLALQSARVTDVGKGSKRAKAILSVAGVNPTSGQGSMAAVCHKQTRLGPDFADQARGASRANNDVLSGMALANVPVLGTEPHDDTHWHDCRWIGLSTGRLQIGSSGPWLA